MYFSFLCLASIYLAGFCARAQDVDCPIVPSVSSDRRQNKTSLRLVQYNVEWLFIDYYANADCPGNNCSWKNVSEAQIHLQYVSNVIKTLDPDIINMCEVEECDELNDVLQNLNQNDLYRDQKSQLDHYGSYDRDQKSQLDHYGSYDRDQKSQLDHYGSYDRDQKSQLDHYGSYDRTKKTQLGATAPYAPYLIKGTDTSTGQNVGMLTKIDPLVNLYRTEERASYPMPGSKCGYTGSPGTSGLSKHYITEFALGDLHIAMIGLHLLAFPTDPTRCAEREAQAQVIQNVISKYYLAEYEIIVLGDFNDFDPDVIDANNNIPTSQVLDIVKGKSGNLAGTYELTNIAEKIPQSERFSDWWDQNGNCISTINEFSMIDHVLMSASVQEHVVGAFIYHGYTEFCGTYNSDHYPVVIDLII